MAADGAAEPAAAGADALRADGEPAGPSRHPDDAPTGSDKRPRAGEAAPSAKRAKPGAAVPAAMDQRAVDYTRAHYDAHARPAVSAAEVGGVGRGVGRRNGGLCPCRTARVPFSRRSGNAPRARPSP
jgi:hypothetical protein